MKVCSAEACERPGRSRGMCTTHYSRWQRTIGQGVECAHEQCQRPAVRGGLCDNHWKRMKRDRPECAEDGCTEPTWGLNVAYCRPHIIRRPVCSIEGCVRRQVSWAEYCKAHLKVGRGCSRPGCERPHRSRGFCALHVGWDRRRNTAATLSEGTAAYDALSDVPLTDYIRWHLTMGSRRNGHGG